MRLETGPIKLGNDWTGIFIRGDHAGYIAFALDELLKNNTIECISKKTFYELLGLFNSANEFADQPLRIQYLKPYEECVCQQL